MAHPTFDDLIEPLFAAMHELGGSASNDEQEEKVAEIMQLSDRQLSEIHQNNRTKFNYRLAWARTYLKLFGVLTNSSRGVWALTAKGQKQKSVSKTEVKKHVHSHNRKKWSRKKDDELEESEELKWQDKALEVIKSISPDAFERLCQRILRESGFTSVEVTGRPGDGGIDGKGVVRLGGLLSFHVMFQCKRHQGSISPSFIRDFRGATLGRGDKGLLITTGTFTHQARKEAKRDGAPPLDLIDGEDLVAKLKELGMGIETKQEVIEKVKVDESYFKDL